jgi:cell division protein FtsZ
LKSLIDNALNPNLNKKEGSRAPEVAAETQPQQEKSVVKPPLKPITPTDKSKGSISDEDLRKTLEETQAKIKVVGCGGSGNNTMSRMTEVGIHGAELIALNTDAQHLLITPADRKILIGRNLTRGLGAGSNPEVGEAAAKESIEDVASVLADADLVFITCGMGGGTGTGSSSVVAQVARDVGALTVGIVTLPFSVEGKKRMENAIKGLETFTRECDTVIVIPNDKLLEIVPELPLNAAFKVSDEVLTNAVKGITEMITKPGLVNLDFADVKTILNKSGASMIGLGESNSNNNGESRALEAVEEALNSPLLDVDISQANRALINVVGGADMTLREAEVICEAVAGKIHKDSHIIWGAMIDENIPRKTIHTMVLVSGGKVAYTEIDSSELSSNNIDLESI